MKTLQILNCIQYVVRFSFIKLNAFVLPFIFLISSSCVGVIEDKNPPITKGAGVDLPLINFAGIHDAVPISDTKIDIFFFGIDGDVRDYTYIITFDGAPNPITVPADSIRQDYRGLMKYTVKDLEIDTRYNFVVEVKNSDGRRSDSTKSLNAKTFNNRTANFDGIGTVRNTAGTDGLTSLNVSWPEAERRGTVFVPNEMDVIEYVITAVDSEFLTPGDMNNREFERPQRYEFIIPGTSSSRVINGLQPGKEYHLQVRAVHKGFVDFGGIPGYQAEENINYITISTLSSDSSSLEFDASNISAQRFNGSLGLTSMTVTWDNAVGAFDHYRIYYNQTTQSFSANSSIRVDCSPTSTTPCKKVRFDQFTTIITDLAPLTEYEVNVAICVNLDCSRYFLFDRKTTVTDPGVASFSGISRINNPRDPNKLNEIYLMMSPPDTTSGNIDGLLVEAKARLSASGPVEDIILNHPFEDNDSNLILGEFSFENVTEISVRGITLGSPEPYCFSVFPYVFEDAVLVEKRGNEVIRCLTPELLAPTTDEFAGLEDVLVEPDTSALSLLWQPPVGGLFQEVRAFLRSDGGSFNFSEAVSGDPNYIMFSTSADSTDLTIPFLPPGTYSVGILTYFNGLSEDGDPGSGYSEFNQSIYSMEIP